MTPFDFALYALAVSAGSITVTRTKITIPIRDWCLGHIPILGQLLECPWCISHWLAGMVVLTLPWTGLTSFVVWTFAIVGAAGLVSGVILTLFLKPENEIRRLAEKVVAK